MEEGGNGEKQNTARMSEAMEEGGIGEKKKNTARMSEAMEERGNGEKKEEHCKDVGSHGKGGETRRDGRFC